MSTFAIVTDSACGLPGDLFEKYSVTVVPVLLNWEGRLVRDGVEVTCAEVYGRLRTDPSLVIKTTTPSVADFLREYDRLLEHHDHVLSIHVAGSLTSVVDVARQAARQREPGKIQVVDSRTASAGLGFAVLAAARARERGSDLVAAAEEARLVGERSRLYGLLETLKYVQASGRLASLGAKAGSSLRLRPLILVADGQVRVVGMVRSRARGLAKLIELVKEKNDGLPIHAGVVHADASEDALDLAAKVQAQVECVEMIVSEFTPVLGGHTGPGFIGVGFYTEPGVSGGA